MADERRILLVDDDPVILRLLKVNFEMEGFAVLTAENGEEGVSVATDEMPDIILLDVMMPGMNGLDAAEKLRGQAGTKDIPIIFVSAKAQSVDVKAGMNAGATDYVTKPFDPVELVQKVEALLAKVRK
jgi:two-component system alkaline phosphatase synthesis response regulator PhoP